MKITKAQLRKLIKEEIASQDREVNDRKAIEAVRKVVGLWDSLWKSLPDNESKQLFEDYLNKNLEIYNKRWREDRGNTTDAGTELEEV